MRTLRLASLALVALVVAVGAIVVAFAGGEAATPTTRATITIEFSKFRPGELTVPAGVPITLLLVNNDPIQHEWIVGDDGAHERHRSGTEPYHDEIPTEVTLRAYETKTTVVVFDEPGEYEFVCHLPGHEAYGMTGTIRVVE